MIYDDCITIALSRIAITDALSTEYAKRYMNLYYKIILRAKDY